ncbi:MAG TPA: isochorismatase family protein [Rectinemataceae bacterium]|nr:isochorismatase family protein [Rectinemataceae bacterium]
MKAALLVIDLQKAFHSGIAATTMDMATETINRAIALFRGRGLPVLWIQHIEEEEGVVPGKEGFEFIDALDRREGEIHVHKTYNNSFTKTDLSEHLLDAGVDTVILAGYCAEYCIIASYWGARSADFRSIILRGAIASDVEENIERVEKITTTLGYDELVAKLAD